MNSFLPEGFSIDSQDNKLSLFSEATLIDAAFWDSVVARKLNYPPSANENQWLKVYKEVKEESEITF